MSSYETFAKVYDTFMSNVPYDKWMKYILKIWQKFDIEPKLILDLACGTGNMSFRLAEAGYETIGIDLSEDMLEEAMEKNAELSPDKKPVLYLNQDMREFELYGTVDCVLCLCDSINYITEETDLLHVFRLVNNYLEPGGLFIFDINTVYKFKNILADNSYGQTTETAAYTWENYYDEEESINEFYTNFFIENPDGTYDRYEEYHYERGYTVEKIKQLLGKAGLILEAVFDDNTFDAPKDTSERIYFIARESGKGPDGVSHVFDNIDKSEE